MLFYCNTTETGEIKEALIGQYVVPDRQFDFFFFLDKERDADKIEHPDDYKVDLDTRQLVALPSRDLAIKDGTIEDIDKTSTTTTDDGTKEAE